MKSGYSIMTPASVWWAVTLRPSIGVALPEASTVPSYSEAGRAETVTSATSAVVMSTGSKVHSPSSEPCGVPAVPIVELGAGRLADVGGGDQQAGVDRLAVRAAARGRVDQLVVGAGVVGALVAAVVSGDGGVAGGVGGGVVVVTTAGSEGEGRREGEGEGSDACSWCRAWRRKLVTGDEQGQDPPDRFAQDGVGEAVHVGRLGVDDHDAGAGALGDRAPCRRPGRPPGSCPRRAAARTRAPPARPARGRRARGSARRGSPPTSGCRRRCGRRGRPRPARPGPGPRSIGARSPQSQQMTWRPLPWISTTFAGSWPAARCRPSVFWVTRVWSRPRRSSSTRARWPAFGVAAAGRAAQAGLPRRPADLGVAEVGAQGAGPLGGGVLRPHAVRATEVGDAGVGRDAGAGQHGDRPGRGGVDPALDFLH